MRTRKIKKIGGGRGGGRRLNWTFKKPITIPYETILGKQGCKPGNNGSEDSCLPVNELQKIALKLNVNIVPNKRSDLCKAVNCEKDSDGGLLGMLDNTFREELEKKYFRPKAPGEWDNDPDAWLDNHSIEAVLKQYEEIDPTFMSMGAVPIDFAAPNPYNGSNDKCLLPEFCKLNLKELEQKGKSGVGMVFNLDPHFKDGSHWVALYVDVEQPGVYYFDSYGIKPPRQIRLLMETLWSQDKRCKLAYNGRRFQYSKSECGMYAMFFIICMHYGIEFKKFVKHRVKDDVMLFLRSWLFNIESKQKN